MEKLKIGDVEIANRFVLAPMAAVNCTAFRLLCKENGVGLIYTQMYDADVLTGKSREEIRDMLNLLEGERPVAVQLIGNDAATVAEAGRKVEEFADIIDFNVGCIVERFLDKGCGGALLQDLERLREIVTALVEAVDVPVTCKIRIGWDGQSINGVAVAQMLEECGIAALAIHGRTVQQKFGKKTNWTIMKQIKEKLSIPVIANGDVLTYDEGCEMMRKTGCDFVMIGREAQHSPWIFDKDFVWDNDHVKAQILRFIDLYEEVERRSSMVELTQHVFWMFRNIKTRLRPAWMRECKDADELRAFMDRIRDF
jgi:tRNA-dihydrouridine synthase B